MGRLKLSLPFGPETMLGRVVRLVSSAVRPVVVAAGSANQDLPDIPDDVVIVPDRRPGEGPLAGLEAGLDALRGRCELALLVACDQPLFQPDVAPFLADRIAEYDLVIPVVEERFHPTPAIYRVALLERVRARLDAGERSMHGFIRSCRYRTVLADELAQVDPDLLSLRNVNSPEEYQAAKGLAGA